MRHPVSALTSSAKRSNLFFKFSVLFIYFVLTKILFGDKSARYVASPTNRIKKITRGQGVRIVGRRGRFHAMRQNCRIFRNRRPFCRMCGCTDFTPRAWIVCKSVVCSFLVKSEIRGNCGRGICGQSGRRLSAGLCPCVDRSGGVVSGLGVMQAIEVFPFSMRPCSSGSNTRRRGPRSVDRWARS